MSHIGKELPESRGEEKEPRALSGIACVSCPLKGLVPIIGNCLKIELVNDPGGFCQDVKKACPFCVSHNIEEGSISGIDNDKNREIAIAEKIRKSGPRLHPGVTIKCSHPGKVQSKEELFAEIKDIMERAKNDNWLVLEEDSITDVIKSLSGKGALEAGREKDFERLFREKDAVQAFGECVISGVIRLDGVAKAYWEIVRSVNIRGGLRDITIKDLIGPAFGIKNVSTALSVTAISYIVIMVLDNIRKRRGM